MKSSQNQEIRQIEKQVESGQCIQESDIIRWMQSDNIEILGAVFVIFDQYADRIESMPPINIVINFYIRYFCRCLIENPSGNYAHSQYTAAHSLASWYKALRKDRLVPKSVLRTVKDVIIDTYKQGDEEVRRCIVHGVLEHLFEDSKIIKDFAYWKQDPTLRKAYTEAMKWAENGMSVTRNHA
jgi:hypothetical protein